MSAVGPARVTELDLPLAGIPLMSPNCWQAISEAVRNRPHCRYLEWGSGNSTMAVLRLALENPSLQGSSLYSVEHDLEFANTMFGSLAQTFLDASLEPVISIEPLRFSKPSLVEAVRNDPGISRYEAGLLKALWDTRNDRFWITAAEPSPAHGKRLGVLQRRMIRLQGLAALRWERIRRSLRSDEQSETVTVLDTAHLRCLPRLSSPTLLTFDTEQVRLQYFVIPQFRNRLSRPGFILDGLYQDFADYVTAPPPTQFDVILVDGRARTSCVKRVHEDSLLAPGGMLFIHDAHRPSYHEAFQLFGTWSFIRGSGAAQPAEVGAEANRAPESPQPPPVVHSGTSTMAAEWVGDRELFYFASPESA
jgi:hypothetical protein